MLAALAAPSWARDDNRWFAAWSRSLTGSLGSDAVAVWLSRQRDQILGSFCRNDCVDQRLFLSGTIAGDALSLEERDADWQQDGAAGTLIGHWSLMGGLGPLAGEWRSADGKRLLPVALRDTERPFPFAEIEVHTPDLPSTAGPECTGEWRIDAIRLRRTNGHEQSLLTDSSGNCGFLLPEILDANFDRWPDLRIALFLPAGAGTPRQYWLYDPQAGLMIDAPASLQQLTSAEFHPEEETVVDAWRAGCCMHGVDVYSWQEGELALVEGGESYYMPVWQDGRIGYCYVTPLYAAGRIVYDPVPIESNGRVTLDLAQADCDIAEPAFGPRVKVEVWGRSIAGLQLLRSVTLAWQRVETATGPRWCPDIPVYHDGRIERVLLQDQAYCLDEQP